MITHIKQKNMKNLSTLSIILFVSLIATNVTAQSNKKFAERVSIEAGAGYLIPISPDEGISASDFAGFRDFYVGANYEFTDLWGLRLTYANQTFQDTNDSSLGVTHHKLMAEGTFNVIEWIEIQRNPFEIVAHAGAGVSYGKSKISSDIDKMGTLQIGVMPLYRITDNFSVHFDATYVMNIKQNIGYDGKQANANGSHVTGEYLNVNVGLGVKFSF